MASKNDQQRMNIDKIVKEYLLNVNSEFNIQEAWLFGSYASGDAAIDSDIDIAVVSDDFPESFLLRTESLLRLRRDIDLRIEPHGFTSAEFFASTPFTNEIKRTGDRIEFSSRQGSVCAQMV